MLAMMSDEAFCFEEVHVIKDITLPGDVSFRDINLSYSTNNT